MSGASPWASRANPVAVRLIFSVSGGPCTWVLRLVAERRRLSLARVEYVFPSYLYDYRKIPTFLARISQTAPHASGTFLRYRWTSISQASEA
jgi:hypothetical protein